jgi:hypothetical protein
MGETETWGMVIPIRGPEDLEEFIRFQFIISKLREYIQDVQSFIQGMPPVLFL